MQGFAFRAEYRDLQSAGSFEFLKDLRSQRMDTLLKRGHPNQVMLFEPVCFEIIKAVMVPDAVMIDV